MVVMASLQFFPPSSSVEDPPPLPLLLSERGLRFAPGPAFFRHESSIGRDLGVLAAALYRQREGQGHLRVLDAMSGCGIRALRYLTQAQADLVLANDASETLNPTIVGNLSRYSPFVNSPSPIPWLADDGSVPIGDRALLSSQGDTAISSDGRWQVTHEEANKLLMACSLKKEFFDMIDVDSFGSDSLHIGTALSCVKYGGLLYLTSTNGLTSGGHQPYAGLAAYGAYIIPMPYCNELGLRMLIGGVVREAALQKVNVSPVFSLYSYHGPVFRVLLRIQYGKQNVNRHYGFISCCSNCGNSQAVAWNKLGRISCSCSGNKAASSMKLSGPLWTGPLHNGKDIQEMIDLARNWGWVDGEEYPTEVQAKQPKTSFFYMRKLSNLLEVMLEESHPDLPVGYVKLDEIAKRGKIPAPSRQELIAWLQKEGYVACRSHITPTALKTNCSMSECVKLVSKLRRR